MVPMAKASSSAVSSGENSITARKRQMGMWLSLHQPGSHGCLYCNKRFSSLQAAGGHQNAHRIERIESEMRQLVIMNKREEEKRREIQEGKRVEIAPSSIITAAPAAPPSAISGGNGIDLELRLGVVPPKKVVEICGFRPTPRVDGGGNYGSAVRDHPMPPRAGGAGAGGGVCWNRAGEFAGAPDQWMKACLLASKTSKKDLDLNLKL